MKTTNEIEVKKENVRVLFSSTEETMELREIIRQIIKNREEIEKAVLPVAR